MKLKDMTKEGFLEEIGSELDKLQRENPDEWISLINTYFESKEIEREVHSCNQPELCNIFDNDLYAFFENENHIDEAFDLNAKFVYKKEGWWHTTDFEDDFVDEKDLHLFIYENQALFEDYIDYDDMYDSEKEEREEIIENGYDEFVETDEDDEEWNKLSEDEKYLLSMSNDMGFNFDEMNDIPDLREKVEELQSRFSKFKK